MSSSPPAVCGRLCARPPVLCLSPAVRAPLPSPLCSRPRLRPSSTLSPSIAVFVLGRLLCPLFLAVCRRRCCGPFLYLRCLSPLCLRPRLRLSSTLPLALASSVCPCFVSSPVCVRPRLCFHLLPFSVAFFVRCSLPSVVAVVCGPLLCLRLSVPAFRLCLHRVFVLGRLLRPLLVPLSGPRLPSSFSLAFFVWCSSPYVVAVVCGPLF